MTTEGGVRDRQTYRKKEKKKKDYHFSAFGKMK
jgi:hypothetical protein